MEKFKFIRKHPKDHTATLALTNRMYADLVCSRIEHEKNIDTLWSKIEELEQKLKEVEK